MVEHEKLLDEYIEDMVRKGITKGFIEKLGDRVYDVEYEKWREEIENIIHKKVVKYVTGKGFPDKGTNKEDIIKEMTRFIVKKIIPPVDKHKKVTYISYLEHLARHEVLERLQSGTRKKAEGISNWHLTKGYEKVTEKMEGKK